MLTDEDDFVVDIFSGSNTTGKVAEKLKRKWLSIDLNNEYVASSVFRFANNEEQASMLYSEILCGNEVTV